MKPRVILLVSSSGDSGSPAFKTTIGFTKCQHEYRLLNIAKTLYCYLAEAFPKGGENKVELGTIVAHSELEQTLKEGSGISFPKCNLVEQCLANEEGLQFILQNML